MEQIDTILDWASIENLLIRNYPIGKSTEGNEAYPNRQTEAFSLFHMYHLPNPSLASNN